jgi:hypothetical protein
MIRTVQVLNRLLQNRHEQKQVPIAGNPLY